MNELNSYLKDMDKELKIFKALKSTYYSWFKQPK